MSFKKDGEIKVYKKGNKVGSKLASVDKDNRFTIDDLVEQDDKLNSKIILEKEDEENVSN